jgi:hypothetical protein
MASLTRQAKGKLMTNAEKSAMVIIVFVCRMKEARTIPCEIGI